MVNRICRPVCGGKIEYWKEYIQTKNQSINPITGQLSKTVKSEKQELDSMTGFKCTKCSWTVNDVNYTMSDDLKKWYNEHEKEIKV